MELPKGQLLLQNKGECGSVALLALEEIVLLFYQTNEGI